MIKEAVYTFQDIDDSDYFTVRPDSIDLLFLGSFPDPFERVARDKNKNKRKKRQNFA